MRQEPAMTTQEVHYYVYFNGHGTSLLRQRICAGDVEEAKRYYPRATIVKQKTTVTTIIEYEEL